MDLVEMQNTKFECQLAPVGDPHMKVEWFFNGKPLPHSESHKFFQQKRFFIHYQVSLNFFFQQRTALHLSMILAMLP